MRQGAAGQAPTPGAEQCAAVLLDVMGPVPEEFAEYAEGRLLST